MIHEVVSDNAHSGNAASGKNIHGNLPNVGAADAQNTAPKSAKRALGEATAFGVWQQTTVTAGTVAARAAVTDTIAATTIITTTVTRIITATAALSSDEVGFNWSNWTFVGFFLFYP